MSVKVDEPWQPTWPANDPHPVTFDHAEIAEVVAGKLPDCIYMLGNVVMHNLYLQGASESCKLNADKKSFTCTKP